jgi:predicted membrane channel-forming protein YqfA (hemolysin III family)
MLSTVVNFCKQLRNSQHYNFFKKIFYSSGVILIVLNVTMLYVRATNDNLIHLIFIIVYDFNWIQLYEPSTILHTVTAKYVDLNISFSTILHGTST